MRNASVWRALLGVEKTVVEGLEFDEDRAVLVARVRREVASYKRFKALTAAWVALSIERSRLRIKLLRDA